MNPQLKGKLERAFQRTAKSKPSVSTRKKRCLGPTTSPLETGRHARDNRKEVFL